MFTIFALWNFELNLFGIIFFLRFTTGHIWACPPSEGDDYIFHCHPADQKIPKPKRLQEWYKKMLDKAVAERIVHDYKVQFKHCVLVKYFLFFFSIQYIFSIHYLKKTIFFTGHLQTGNRGSSHQRQRTALFWGWFLAQCAWREYKRTGARRGRKEERGEQHVQWECWC